MRQYFLRHLQVLFATLGQFGRTPLSTGLSILVIGISLALPTALYLAVKNLQQLSLGFAQTGQISLFLKKAVTEETARRLARRIQDLPGVGGVDYISPAQALTEFKQGSGFGDALDSLPHNPLPPVLVVQPKDQQPVAQLEALAKRLRDEREVEFVQLDTAWVQRLQALLRLAERAAAWLAVLLALGVALIVGNTIRLSVLNRRTEIEIVQLVGGTSGFIRRPFLYAGLLQGLLGAAAAALLVYTGLAVLTGPARTLAELYGSPFTLTGLQAREWLLLFIIGSACGWLGAWTAVTYHLRKIHLNQ